MMRKSKTRKCRNKACGEQFTPFRMGQIGCCTGCEIVLAKDHIAKAQNDRAKAERKADKAKLLELKPKKWWIAKAKTAFHAVVRAKAEGKECASCDTILLKLGRTGGDYDAGHFRPVGLAKHLEFDPRNVWGQCKRCNDHLRGNFQEYERRLRLRKGDAFVDELLADNEPRHLKISDYQEIEARYKAELKELQKCA